VKATPCVPTYGKEARILQNSSGQLLCVWVFARVTHSRGHAGSKCGVLDFRIAITGQRIMRSSTLVPCPDQLWKYKTSFCSSDSLSSLLSSSGVILKFIVAMAYVQNRGSLSNYMSSAPSSSPHHNSSLLFLLSSIQNNGDSSYVSFSRFLFQN
jgi:hypothetical protein